MKWTKDNVNKSNKEVEVKTLQTELEHKVKSSGVKPDFIQRLVAHYEKYHQSSNRQNKPR